MCRLEPAAERAAGRSESASVVPEPEARWIAAGPERVSQFGQVLSEQAWRGWFEPNDGRIKPRQPSTPRTRPCTRSG